MFAREKNDPPRRKVFYSAVASAGKRVCGCGNFYPSLAVMMLMTAFFLLPAAGQAQVGFTAYVGGTLPVGEFGTTDIERDPPKSGAEYGHVFGGGAAWRILAGDRQQSGFGLHPEVIITVGYAESEFGNDVPKVVVADTMQFATPNSRILLRGLRLGLRIVPWAQWTVSPTVGCGFQSGKMKVESRAFFGPGAQAGETNDALALQITSESDNVPGVFGQVGIAMRSSPAAIFFADAVYHHFFSEDVSTTTEFSPSDDPPEQGKIKSNFQWWEIRAGLIFFLDW